MGTQKRYDVYTEKLAQIEEAEARKPKPIGLPDSVVRSTGRRRDEEQPVPVQAQLLMQVTYTEVQMVDAVVIAHTPGGCVLLRYTPPGERFTQHVWVWASSVRRAAI